MAIQFALDELYATGWNALDSAGCAYSGDGRAYPTPGRGRAEFDTAQHRLSLERVEAFDCYRAVWSDATGTPLGSAVATSEHEAAVYALARLRQHLRHAAPATI